MEKMKKYRLQIDFSEEAYAELEELQRRIGGSKSDVIRNSLGWFKWTADEISQGNRVLIEKHQKGGKEEIKEIVFPSLFPKKE